MLRETGARDEAGSNGSATASLEELLQPALDQLRHFANLPSDWDSYGAAPITDAAIRRAREVLGLVQADFTGKLARVLGDSLRPFAVAPTASGGVQLEWRGPSGCLEVEISPAGEYGFLIASGVGARRQYRDLGTGGDLELFTYLVDVLMPRLPVN